jgi:aryl-alcohol dehydrogenase-like predicted oxidoreductase
MNYRRLGRSGLKLSALSFGSWVTYGNQVDARGRSEQIIVGELEAVARDLGCTLAQLALAWCLANPNVGTVITGATRVAQIEENMKALEVAPKLDAEAMRRIDAIVGTAYD